MAFLESTRFPESVSYEFAGGPSTNTDVVTVSSGAEFRNRNWDQARRKYSVNHVANQTKLDQLKAFFLVVGGRAIGFRVKDWSDFLVPTGTGFFSQIGATNTYQMIKRYTVGSSIHDRTITKPVSGPTAIAGTGTYTVDYATGIVTKVSGAAPSSWGGEFDVPCRFDVDEFQATIFDKSGSVFIYHLTAVPLIEIRDIA